MAPRGQVTARNIRGGRSHDDPVGPRLEPRAPSRTELWGPGPTPGSYLSPVISFKPRTQAWLAEAINGLVDPEALADTGDYIGNTQERSPNDPVVLRPTPGPYLSQ